MELEQIWFTFLDELKSDELVEGCFRKNITGIPFLYVHVSAERVSEWESRGSSIIAVCSKKAMFRKKVTVETHFVRVSNNLYVYRHRFFVPQEKMFCCGNLCADCIRLRKKA
ncbi:hypothetical protein JOC95_003622 [Bacillus tianshenii]|uniref:Uncharacterized protein n=1 Tax=Sutcliffiella tianshenii TaxID=1463404 RepID=A0ABS2P4A6_9BACI|nr:hypothetical protein [Bacillus tianshenii]MBM7621714.1 hypothetical protein [Bacillus tianshenii]